ncbi:MAG TPA: pitrilysin family protein [Tepidisphaeraceae bacterium]|nr:pitrilysin family protein [Tepidisphaeraceae bacterium]
MLKFFHHQLDNGLNVIAESNANAQTFAAGLFVRTGSRNEAADIGGVSHFLEHMMFKGSEKYTWEDVNRIFDEIGARANAFTGQEMTAYFAQVLPEFTERTLEHLSHLLRPAIREKDFETEKKVILEEIAMYLDEPGHRLYESAMKAHYGRHPMGRSVLGSIQSIRRLPRDRMARYFNSNYGPGNMVLAATGRLNFDRLVRLAEKYCGVWKPVKSPPAPAQPQPRGVHELKIVDRKLNRHYTMGIATAPSGQDERRFAARVLADVIGDAEGSRLFWALVDNAIAEAADFCFEPNMDCGIYTLTLVTEPKRAARALKIALDTLDGVMDDLDEEEVRRVRNKIASGIVLEGESPMGRLRTIASQWIYNGDYRSLEMDMKTLEQLDADALRAVMKDFPIQPRTIVKLGPA